MYLDFGKYADRLVPTIVQDATTEKVLMLGFTSAESLRLTKETGRVTFYSRSRQEIWVKGETSGYYLDVDDIRIDCDDDTILIKAKPTGPTCHTGADTCFGETNNSSNFLFELENTIRDRKENPTEGSYTSSLFAEGLNRIAQKVGEEAVEVVIAAKDADDEAFRNEAADLLYHLTVLLTERNLGMSEVFQVLRSRASK